MKESTLIHLREKGPEHKFSEDKTEYFAPEARRPKKVLSFVVTTNRPGIVMNNFDMLKNESIQPQVKFEDADGITRNVNILALSQEKDDLIIWVDGDNIKR